MRLGFPELVRTRRWRQIGARPVMEAAQAVVPVSFGLWHHRDGFAGEFALLAPSGCSAAPSVSDRST